MYGSSLGTPAVTSADQLFCGVLLEIGAPLIGKAEITKEQMQWALDNTVRLFRRYESLTKAAIVLDTNLIEDPLTGAKLPDNVLQVRGLQQNTSALKGINTLFSAENILYSQGGYGFLGAGYGGSQSYSIVTWHLLQSWLEDLNMVLGQKVSYEYNEFTKVLTWTPTNFKGHLVLDAVVETPLECLYGLPWIHKYFRNEVFAIVNRVRMRFGNTQLLGGGSLQNIREGDRYEETRDKLEQDLIDGMDSEPIDMFVG